MKQVYKMKQHYSTFHKFLNEEGWGTMDVAVVLDISEPTARNYFKDPTILNARHFKVLMNELEVDANFLMAVIYG
jgi:hypothetical protein|tara:strand:+ start:4008 stop:4232 length:225 start_codon:yes stop_codon:yes gene_type:complete